MCHFESFSQLRFPPTYLLVLVRYRLFRGNAAILVQVLIPEGLHDD
jgi:hypothetical protein